MDRAFGSGLSGYRQHSDMTLLPLILSNCGSNPSTAVLNFFEL